MRTYEVRTYGCQMNVHDSERLTGLLEEAGYVAAPGDSTPDVVVFNTCAVRENADANDPTLPRLANEPTDPIESTEPSDHSESTEPRDPIDQRLFTGRGPSPYRPGAFPRRRPGPGRY